MKTLKNRPVVIGTRQSLKHISAGKAEAVILAQDTDQIIADQIDRCCRENKVPIHYCASKHQLGMESGISRPTAVVTVLKT